jgi:hypothetical protein
VFCTLASIFAAVLRRITALLALGAVTSAGAREGEAAAARRSPGRFVADHEIRVPFVAVDEQRLSLALLAVADSTLTAPFVAAIRRRCAARRNPWPSRHRFRPPPLPSAGQRSGGSVQPEPARPATAAAASNSRLRRHLRSSPGQHFAHASAPALTCASALYTPRWPSVATELRSAGMGRAAHHRDGRCIIPVHQHLRSDPLGRRRRK